MAYQLVVSGNRILSHGEDCFLSMGGTVICTDTGRTFDNATVVTHNGSVPCDLDRVGYEYHAGEFVPCAPFGHGDGNVAILSDAECKALKDSGIPFSQMVQHATTQYTGSGGRQVSLTFDFVVDMLLIFSTATDDFAIITPLMATTFIYGYDSSLECDLCKRYKLSLTETGSTVTWRESQNEDPYNLMNGEDVVYKVVAFGHREV